MLWLSQWIDLGALSLYWCDPRWNSRIKFTPHFWATQWVVFATAFGVNYDWFEDFQLLGHVLEFVDFSLVQWLIGWYWFLLRIFFIIDQWYLQLLWPTITILLCHRLWVIDYFGASLCCFRWFSRLFKRTIFVLKRINLILNSSDLSLKFI